MTDPLAEAIGPVARSSSGEQPPEARGIPSGPTQSGSMATPPRPSTSSRSGSPGCGCLPLLGATLVLVVLSAATLIGAFGQAAGDTGELWTSIVITVSALLLVVLGILTVLARNPGQRAMLLSWLLAVPLAPLMLPATSIPPAEAQLASIVRVGVALLYVGLLHLMLRLRGRAASTRSFAGIPIALGAAALLAYPWLLWGAAGSPLDVVLDLAAGLLLGWAASRLICDVWLRTVNESAGEAPSTISLSGFVIGLTLLLLTWNFGFNGGSLVLMVALPPLGWLAVVAAALGTGGRHSITAGQPAVAVLLGLAAALPLVFSDVDMLPLISLAAGTETLAWSMLAATVMAGIGVVLSVLLVRLPVLPRLASTQRGGIIAGLWLVGAVIYATLGQPGFYGDRLFVILADQADVSAAESIAAPNARRQVVYERLTRHAEQTQAELRQALDRLGIRYTPYYLVNALEVQADTPVRLWLEQQPAVDRVLPSPVLRPLPAPLPVQTGSEPPPQTPPWNLRAIRAVEAWTELGARGQGIVVGQSDSGVDWQHPELRDGYRGIGPDGTVSHDYHWFDPWEHSPAPDDPNGHGTHTLGIALGETVGVAPDASWIGCRNLLRNIGNAALYLDCLQFMLAPFPLGGDPFRDGDPTRAAHVLNNSWGCPARTEGCDPQSLEPAVRALRAAGIFVVASAGNEGPKCSTVADPIAIYGEVLSVGALTPSGEVAFFSSVGPVTVDGSGRLKPDLLAPGTSIVSAFPNGTYFLGDGTSQAGPHVAGVVALMWSANPALIGDIEATERILIESARPHGGEQETVDLPLLGPACGDVQGTAAVPNTLSGYGVIDAYRAVQRAREWTR